MAYVLDDIQSDVAVIFLSYFQRAPEFDAMQHYVGVYESLLANPETADSAFTALSAQIYADGSANKEVPNGPTITDAWYVNYVYTNILGRAPDADGATYWTQQLESGNLQRADLVGTFVGSALANEGRDADFLNNRTEVAVAFSQWENSNPNILDNLEYNSAEVLLGVNEDPATVTTALGHLESTTGVIGETKNLITGIDTIAGTTGNDTFNAVYYGSQSTLTAFDSINGDLGTDTLNIYVEDGANTFFPGTATVKNIEIVNVFNGNLVKTDGLGSGEAYLLSAANYEGIEQLWQIEGAQNVTNITDDVIVGFRNIKELGSSTAVEVNLAQGSSIANIALENISGGGDDDVAKLAVRGATTVNVTGALNEKADDLELAITVGAGVAAVEVNTAVDTELTLQAGRKDGKKDEKIVKAIDTIDASGSTGDILLVLDAKADSAENDINANSLTATFGSGDDVVYFNTRALTLRDAIDGGEGDNTLALTVAGTVQTQTYDAIALTKNFQNVAFVSDSATTIDVKSLGGFEAVIVGGKGAFNVNNLTSDAQLVIATDDDLDIGKPATVTLVSAAADVNVALSGDLLSQLEIGSATTAPTTAPTTAQVGATGGQLTLSGEGGLIFSNALTVDNKDAAKFSVIDASDLEGVKANAAAVNEVLEPADVQVADENYQVGLLLAQVDASGDVTGAGLSSAVAETVQLNIDTIDAIVIDLESSTYGKMDTIVGFNSDAKAGDVDYLVMFGQGATDLDLFELSLDKNVTSLKLAFEAAAKKAAEVADTVIYFAFEDDTYLFAEGAGDGNKVGEYDDADFALKIVGVQELGNSWLTLDAA